VIETEEIEIDENTINGKWYISGYSISDSRENKLYETDIKIEESPLLYNVENDKYDIYSRAITFAKIFKG